MSIQEAQERVNQWIQTLGVKYFHELTNTAILIEEVGEMSRLMARMYGEQSFKKSDPLANASQEEKKQALADEMADVLWVLLCLANQTGIRLDQALEANLAKKTQRDFDRHINNPKLQ